jgi:hypothetical protein
MAKWATIVLAVLAVALVGVIVWQVAQRHDPVYQGKPLSSFIKAYAKSQALYEASPSSEAARAASKARSQLEAALRQSKSNALLLLLRSLRAKDSPLKVKLMTALQRQHTINVEYIPAPFWNAAALEGLQSLYANAASAVPALLEFAHDNVSSKARAEAISTFSCIGPSAREAVPSLLQWATNADSEVRRRVFEALQRVEPEPSQVLPTLTNALHDPDREVQERAAGILCGFKENARPAVPALIDYFMWLDDQGEHSPDTYQTQRRMISSTIQAIDPEAASILVSSYLRPLIPLIPLRDPKRAPATEYFFRSP